MSFFSGYEFFVYLIMLLIPAVILGLKEKPLRIYRISLTLFFIWMVYKDSPMELVYLAVYVIGASYLVKIYLFFRNKYERNVYIYGHAVFFALLPLVLSKVSGLYGKNIFGFLGISYICFRVIQVIIEIYDGVIKEINVTEFLMFLVFFPALASGPIDRSRRFKTDNERIYSREEYAELLEKGVYKLILGMFYKIVCSVYFYELLMDVFAGRYRPQYIIGYAYIYGLYMFFDFAGYSAMAVGTSYILGIRMSDNFNKPFLSIDMKDFWNRWHITLSVWLRDFVFTRFIMDSARKKRFKNRLNSAAAGLMLNMALMGAWHGLEAHYIAYGVYHGILMSGTEIYQKKSKFYQKYKNKTWYKGVSWFFTLNMVMFGFLIFSGRINEIWSVAVRYL